MICLNALNEVLIAYWGLIINNFWDYIFSSFYEQLLGFGVFCGDIIRKTSLKYNFAQIIENISGLVDFMRNFQKKLSFVFKIKFFSQFSE